MILRLLPNIEYEGHIISLQDPVIVDGKLVLDCEVNISVTDPRPVYDRHSNLLNWRIGERYVDYFVLKTNETNLRIDPAKFAAIVRNNFDHNTVYYYSCTSYHYYNGFINYSDDLGYHENREVNLNDRNSVCQWFLDRISADFDILDIEERQLKLLKRLRAQGRATFNYFAERYEINQPININATPANINHAEPVMASVDGIANDIVRYYSTAFSENYSHTYRNLYTNEQFTPYMSSVNTNQSNENPQLINPKKYIHYFNYKPKYIHHFMDDEKHSTTLLLGAEIEVAGNDPFKNTEIKESVVKKCIQIMNGSDSDEEKLIYSTSDSTVQIELDTMPCSLEYHKNKMNYREMFQYLDSEGYKGHDCENAGLHVHACRSYLGDTKFQQDIVISKILYIIEKFNDELCIIARRDNKYSVFVGDKCKEDNAITLYQKYDYQGKKAALNLKHPETIEFRMFRSTLKYETFILTLELVKDIIDFAKGIHFEELESIKWNDLMNTFSNDLRIYYADRKRKLNNKTSMSDEDFERQSYLKKKINTLKKSIKRCISSLEQKRLNKELNDIQTEYARLNKKCNKKLKKIKNSDIASGTITFQNGSTIESRGINNATIYARGNRANALT